jgi:kumamolisin
MTSGLTPIKGSHREPLRDAKLVGPVDPNSQLTVSLLLRRGGGDASQRLAEIAGSAPRERQHVSPEEFRAQYGANPDDIAAIHDFAQHAGLNVLESSVARRTVVLQGSAHNMSEAFGVQLHNYEHPQLGRYRGRTGPVEVPQELGNVIEGVFGLDNRPQAEPRFVRDGQRRRHHKKHAPTSASPYFTPPQVAELYGFPAGPCRNRCIALIELGGGYRETDLNAYFQELGIAPPTVVAVGVDGAANSPGSEADVEVVLDIEVAGSVAGQSTVVVYFAPNTSQGFLDAITTATHDTTHSPDVISISWGGPELSWTEQSMEAMDQAFADAALLGVTVTVAAGDHGAGDAAGDGKAHADFPASSPHALACGGTHLEAKGGQISLENVWNNGNGWAGGGGVSDFFALPAWQKNAGVPPSANGDGRIGRGLPDVSGDADGETGYIIHINGADTTVGGTSAVAPLWAALTALLNERLGARVGYMNPLLYNLTPAQLKACFHDILDGNNIVPESPNGYKADQGWDACSGWGSPIGAGLLTTL